MLRNKKIQKLAVTLASVMLLAACGKTATEPNTPAVPETVTTQPVVETPEELPDNTGELPEQERPIIVWTQGQAIKNQAEAWAEANGVDVEVVVIPHADLQMKLRQSVQDPSTAPDVFAITRDFVRDWTERYDFVVNLDAMFPADAAYYRANAFDDLVMLGTGADGALRGVTAEYPVGMMYYNIAMAREIFGTDDPEEVTKAMSDIDNWEETYVALKEAYGGDVKMFGLTLNVNTMLYNQRLNPYIENDVFTLTPEIMRAFEVNKVIYDHGMFIDENTETTAYTSSWSEERFFIDFLPSWGFGSRYKANVEGTSAEGNWAITMPPLPYARGGSFFFIPTASSQPEWAWELIKGISVDPETLFNNQFAINGFSSNGEANDLLIATGHEETLLGGDNRIFEAYRRASIPQEAMMKDRDVVTPFDGEVQRILNEAIIAYASGQFTLEQALDMVEDDITAAWPNVTVVRGF